MGPRSRVNIPSQSCIPSRAADRQIGPRSVSTSTHNRFADPQVLSSIRAPGFVKSSIEASSCACSARSAVICATLGTYHHTATSVTAIAANATMRCCQAARHSDSFCRSISVSAALLISDCRFVQRRARPRRPPPRSHRA